MSIIGFVPSPETAATVVAWTRALAGEREEIVFLCLGLGSDGRAEAAARAALDEKLAGSATLISIEDPAPVQAVAAEVRRRDARLLVTGAFELPAVGDRPQTALELVRASPCQTLSLLFGAKQPSDLKRVLMVVTGEAHDRPALRLVETLRKRLRARVTIGAVEDESGAQAGRAGANWIQSLVHDERLDQQDFEIKVVVDRLKHRGVIELFDDHDLIVAGANAAGHLRPLRQSLGAATVALVKRTPPLRLTALAEWLPRINPADLADLRYSLRMGSQWAPDFVCMLALASAIASLGLMQNSPAVVIGSMLLAPLMTPMIGLGLALCQANLPLGRMCGKSIGLGVLLTLAVSMTIGAVTPAGETLSEEVLARGGPNVLDLLIAVFAAAAATFAMSRPNIVGAIAGVAIATALVPPICSIGISLAAGEWVNAYGAALLFVTNLIAIIVMSNFVFWLLGVTAERALPRIRRRALVTRVALVALLLAVAGPLSTALIAGIEEGKNVAAAHPVTRAVARALYDRVGQDEGVEIMFMARPRGQHRVMIHIASHDALPRSYADDLTKIVRDQMDDPDVAVTVVAVRGLWRSDTKAPE